MTWLIGLVDRGEKWEYKKTRVGGIMKPGFRFSRQTRLEYLRDDGNHQFLIFHIFNFHSVYTRHKHSGKETNRFISLDLLAIAIQVLKCDKTFFIFT